MQFFIYSPPYDPNSGGIVVLHRLCHLINQLTNHSAYLIPTGYPTVGTWKKVRRFLRGALTKPHNYKTQKEWNTPIWHKVEISQSGIAIYSEMEEGNRLGCKNVVRWLLHQPGFHTGKVQYGENELYFKFNSAIKDFNQAGSYLSQNELKVIYYPIDFYYEDENQEKDIECCYMVRKGGYKTFIHPENSVCVDGLSHQETANIFRRSKRFICYDDYTAYSIFAILCGCESIVIPSPEVSLTQWYPNETDRYGIAYGLNTEQLEWAEKTKNKVYEHILNEHKKSEQCVLTCVKEIEEFFSEK